MITVCGRTRLMVSIAMMVCLLLWCGYLYSDYSPSDTRGTRRWHRPPLKGQAVLKPFRHHQYRHFAFSPRRLSDLNFRSIRGRTGRHAHWENRRLSLHRDQAKYPELSRSRKLRKGSMVEPQDNDQNEAYYDHDNKHIVEFSPEEEMGDDFMEVKREDEDWAQLDPPLSLQRRKLHKLQTFQRPGSQYKRKRMLYQNSQVNHKHRIPGKTGSKTIKAFPNFSAEHLLSQASAMKVNKSFYHDKWIVVTSVLPPTPDVIFLSEIPEWRVLVVGDTKTPSNWSSPNCIFLSLAQQEALGLSLAKRTPYRSYSRKNLGYLFAVAHGAKIIYETDDDNRPVDLLKSFRLSPTMSGLMFAGDALFNPYHHFGQFTLWPRGYPLGAVGSPQNNFYRLNSKWKTPAIQQGVVNGDPDMDAIFRLTRKQTTSRLRVTFDPTAPPAILPEGVFSPFNSQNTLFTYEALWAMLLPTTTTFRMCDIWRGYWAQRLLWEIGARLSFVPPNAYQQRNAHSYMEDAEDERDMYFQTDRLLSFLSNWSCPQHLSFFQCVYMLSVEMAEKKFWKAGDIEVTRLWLQDLVRVGYREPKRAPLPDSKVERDKHSGIVSHTSDDRSGKSLKRNKATSPGMSELAFRRLLTLRNGTAVYFAASQQDPPSVYTKTSVSLSEASQHAHGIVSLCPQLTNISLKADAIREKHGTYFDDILLVVVFNWPHYTNVKYLETIYRHVFPNIAYCGGNPDIFLAQTKELDNELTFINAPVMIGVYGYACFIAAAQMGYNVTGYMVVGDDVLVNVWNFHGFDKDRIWSNFAVHIFNVNNGTNWSWWGYRVGEQAYRKSMAAIWEQEKLTEQNKTIQNQNGRHYEQSVSVKSARAFLSTLHTNTGGPANCPHAVSDVYYIPARLAPSAIHYMSVFARKGLMVELAVSMTLYGLSPRDTIQFFSGENLWLGERLDPWRKFNPVNFFLHPVKFSNTSNLQPFCSQYLTTLLSKMYEDSSGHASRKAYIERLQRSYRDRQDLQHELLATKKRKEEANDKAHLVRQEAPQMEGEKQTQKGKPRYETLRRHRHEHQLVNGDDKSSQNQEESKRSYGLQFRHKQQKRGEKPPDSLEEKETLHEQRNRQNDDDSRERQKQSREQPPNAGLLLQEQNGYHLDEKLFEEDQDQAVSIQQQHHPKGRLEANQVAQNEKLALDAEPVVKQDLPDISVAGDPREHAPPHPPPAPAAPQPEHVRPQPEHVQPQPEDVRPQPEHVRPQPEHVRPQPEDMRPQPEDMRPQPEHVRPQPEHVRPQPEHVRPQPEHVQPFQAQRARPHRHHPRAKSALRHDIKDEH